MARKCDEIKVIDGKKETLKLHVRIMSLWDCKNRDRTSQLEMVVMDCKGDKIQVVIRKDEVDSWRQKLVEGKSYVMHNFKVVANDGQYKVCDHAFKLLCTSGTSIIENDFPNIPLTMYNFKDLGDVLSGKYRNDLLIDVIGGVQKIVYNGLSNNPKKMVFQLMDLNGNCINCTLWEDYAVKFLDSYNQFSSEQSFVMILSQARIKEGQGLFPISISNSFYGSKLIMNENIPEIQQFKERFAGVCGDSLTLDYQPALPLSSISPTGLTTFSPGSSQRSAWTHFTEQDKFMYKASPKTLAEINAVSEELIFVTVGTTAKFVIGPHGWYYDSCSRCNKKAEKVNESFTCPCGCYNEKSYLRYKLEVEVYFNKHNSKYKLEVEVYFNKHNSKFAFFDRECCHLIGMNASELRKMMIEAGEPDDPRLYPEPLDRMLGYTLACRVKVQPKFNNCSVIKMSTDAELVKFIIGQFPSPDTASQSDKEQSDLNIISLCDTQSLSATAEHDPHLSVFVTPEKRNCAEMESLDDLTPELGSAKESSTKLAKQIKTE